MSHSLGFFPVIPLSFAMIISTNRSLLVAPGSTSDSLAPTGKGALKGTVSIAPVTRATNHTHCAAATARKSPKTIN
jgi:hypothetical protein